MKNRPHTTESIAANLKMLMEEWPMPIDELAQRSGITKRMIHYVINLERVPSVKVAESLASAFGMDGWQLLVPNLHAHLVRNGKLGALVDNYSRSSESARAYIDDVARREGTNG